MTQKQKGQRPPRQAANSFPGQDAASAGHEQPQAAAEQAAARSPIAGARRAVCEFLEETLADVRKVNVNKLVQTDAPQQGWEAEAEVWHPNATVQMLGLETSRPVLDRDRYFVRLDANLNILGYALKELTEGHE